MIPGKPSRGVDCHAHVFSATAPGVVGARYRPAYAATLGAWRLHWPAAGITHGVLVQPSFFGTDNAELLAALAADPRHLRGVAVVNPAVDDADLRRLHAAGVRALRLNLRGGVDASAYASAAWGALFVRAYALGWHLEVFVDPGGLPAIAHVLADSPIGVLFDHFGSPGGDSHAVDATFRAVAGLAATRPVWCKLSAPYRLNGGDPHAFAARWLEIVGPDRLVWGSDWPWTAHENAGDYGRLRGALDRWVGVDKVAAVLWDNAMRLYDFADSDSA
jgi:predicted TIM-barrel fold metal-dependent hydrolase